PAKGIWADQRSDLPHEVTCAECHQTKPIGDFPVEYRMTNQGKRWYTRVQCKLCKIRRRKALKADPSLRKAPWGKFGKTNLTSKGPGSRGGATSVEELPAEGTCTACGETKPRDQFYVERRDGLVTMRSQCIACMLRMRREKRAVAI